MSEEAPRLRPSHFKAAEYAHTVYSAGLIGDMKFEDTLQPEFWVSVAPMLKIGDLIQVRHEQNSFFATLYVTDVAKQDGPTLPNWAKVAVIQHTDFTAKLPVMKSAKSTTPAYVIEFKAAAKFCVVRTADQTIVFRDGASKEAAQKWIDDNFPT